MEELITNIYQTLADYRADENDPQVCITQERIKTWINQFEESLRIPILTELDNIFKKRYYSKENVKDFIRKVITRLTTEFKFPTEQDFLRNSDFLNLQPEGKSQRVLLDLFNELIQEKHGLALSDCGTVSKKYSIYIDDILCTGLTLMNDIKGWVNLEFSQGKTNLQAVSDNSTTLVFAYVFIHEKNYNKKISEMRFKFFKIVAEKHKMFHRIKIENGTGSKSKIDLIMALENGQPQNAIGYKDSIVQKVNEYSRERNYNVSSEEFFRPGGLPLTETFFTSTQNRVLLENAFLQKGIEILSKAQTSITNIRALGYSLPSKKDFGFGALCFTWRNVPNNAPLVFWYSGGGFIPLFKVTRSVIHAYIVNDAD